MDNAAAMGLPEAGAMAALLGGTATYSAVEPGLNNEVFNENPDDPAAEQRRFNFFDYAADGQLNGSITMNELKMLSRILLPAPDAYTITDRQRASANGFLLDPTAQRNFVALQRTLPTVSVGAPKSGQEVSKHFADEVRHQLYQVYASSVRIPALHTLRSRVDHDRVHQPVDDSGDIRTVRVEVRDHQWSADHGQLVHASADHAGGFDGVHIDGRHHFNPVHEFNARDAHAGEPVAGGHPHAHNADGR